MANLPPLLLPPNIAKHQLLLSTQVYDIVDLLCEGPIYGFIDASGKKVEAGTQQVTKAIYFNNVPVMDTDSNGVNFQNFDLDLRLGSGNQTPLVFPKNTSREKVYMTDMIGPWDWDNPETLDPRKYGGNTKNYGQWETRTNGPAIDEDIIPESDAIPIWHEIENSWVDKVRVNVLVESLHYVQHTAVKTADVGRKKPHYIAFSVERGIRLPNGQTSGVTTTTTTIRGLVDSSAYGYSLELDLPERRDGENVYLKITRSTPETASPLIGRKMKLDSVVEIITKLPFTYPLSAIAGWTIDARTFRTPPQRSYRIRGKLIRIPSNYFPLQDTSDEDLALESRPTKGNTMDWRRYARGETYATHSNGTESPVDNNAFPPAHIYRGNWDGTFKWGWTDNPVWILYDLLINDVYGLGNFINPSLIDKWTLYKIGRYCDAVDDAGYFVGVQTLEGGLEPRYSCNVIIDNEQEAFSLINFIAGIFRGIAFWNYGGIYFADDSPKTPVMYFGNADVRDGIFNYQDTIKNGRFTVCEISYNDRNDNYLPKTEFVEDSDGILSLGVIKNQIQGLGITSRSEARRLGLYQIYSSQQEPEIVNFSAGLKAAYLRPGDIIGISDEIKQMSRYNGVIVNKYLSGNRLYLNLDAPLPSGVTTGTNIIVTLPWGFNTLENLNSQQSGGIPNYAIEGSRTKQYMTLPVENISVNRQTIDLNATGIEIYGAPEPTSGDYVVNTGINITKVPLTEAYKYIPPFSLYLAQSSGMQHSLYRVMTISEKNTMEYEIGCVEYDSGKFFRMENEQLGYDNTDEIFGDFNEILLQPNPVKSLNITKQNPVGALFDVNVSWNTPTTPPALAGGAGAGQPDPYKIQLTDPSGITTNVTTTGLSYIFSNLSNYGTYSARVWSVSATAPNHLVSVPSIYSKYIPSNNFVMSGVIVTGMNVANYYSGFWSSGSGIFHSTRSQVEINWAIGTPDGNIISNGQSIENNSFDINQNIYFYDSSGSIVSGLTQSGYNTTKIIMYPEALISGFGYYPRDFTAKVVVSGNLAPDTNQNTGAIQILNLEPEISTVYITAQEGTNEWPSGGGGPIFIGPDQVTGEILLDIQFNHSGYGDINKVHVYTGDTSGFTVDANSFYATYELGLIPLSTQQISLNNGLVDENEQPYLNPYYISIVVEDSVGTGSIYSSNGMSGILLADPLEDDWYVDLNNQISGILSSGQFVGGQKIHSDVLGTVSGFGAGRVGVGLPLENYTSLTPALQSIYNSGDCISGSGIFPRELFHVSGKSRFDGPIIMPSVTLNQITGISAIYPASGNTGAIVYVTNMTSGAEPAFSAGTGWFRVSTRLPVS